MINHGADVNAKSKHFITALMIACHRGDTDAINVLLNAGTDPNITDAYGYTCLHNAVRACFSTQVLETIINHGADMNAIAKNHTTALMIACQKGNEVAIHVLMSSGANLNIADENDSTCLHEAVMSGCNTGVLQAIIDHGADVSATNKNRQSILRIACQMGNVDAIHVLLKAEADPTITDTKGDTYLHYAVREDYSKEVLQAIIIHSDDVNATNKNNITALMTACKTGNVDAIGMFLHAGADPNTTQCDGDTCLHEAISAGCNKEIL